MTNKLLIFEIKITRKIFGPTRTNDGYRRIKTNQEINDILKGKIQLGLLKKQRLNWLGYVERKADDNIVKRVGNPCLKDQLEDLKHVEKMTFWKI